MRKVILLFILITSVLGAWADGNVTFTASAPDVVVSGDQFRLTYTVNTQKVRDFRAPNIKGFDVLMGPSRSQQSSTQIINGNVTSTSSITFTYILMADKEGTYTIPGATIVADGQNKTSNSVQIKVLPPDQANGVGGGNNSGGRTSSRSQVAGSKITNQDLFITATASKTTVYEQEAILLTYKVYTLVNLRQLYGKMPDLKNFHTQEVELPQQKTFSLEHYNGRNYNTTVWSQYVLFPQQSGKMEIPSITFEGVIAQQVASDDPFDAFFNGGSNYVEVKKNIVTPKLTINVKALPDGKPINFSGGVGEFTISSSISTKELKTNDAVTIKLVISGTGNLKLVNTPEVAFPKDFEVYDPKIDNKFTLTREGLSGNKVIEYLAIPRHAGNFTIPPVEFSYFDLKSNSYKTIKTEAYNLKVEKGAGNADQVIADFTNKEEVPAAKFDIDGDGQVAHARIAVATSNVVGKGPGNSVQRDFLSQAFSDFIYAIIIEELGLVGGIVVVFLYVCLLVRVGRIAKKCDRTFPAFLITGIALLLVTQALFNMMVAVGLAPVTGQPLPLISKGGTSTFINCAYIGMILSVSRYTAKLEEQRMHDAQVPMLIDAGNAEHPEQPADSEAQTAAEPTAKVLNSDAEFV